MENKEAMSKVDRVGWKNFLEEAPAEAQVLIVDDEDDIRKGLDKLLSRMGYKVKTAASAEEADEWLQTTRFHLMLLDIELPRMKGTEFLGWSLSRDPEMPVIMLTGLDSPDLAVRCIDDGARTYLVKPVEAEFLRLAVRDALALRNILVELNEGRSVA